MQLAVPVERFLLAEDVGRHRLLSARLRAGQDVIMLMTVISGDIAKPLKAMPTARSPLYQALHWLSADDSVQGLPAPASAFVPQWNGVGYSWPPSSLVYMLRSGTSTLS